MFELNFLMGLVFLYTFIYPCVMTIIWITGGSLYQKQYKKTRKVKDEIRNSAEEIAITVIIPVYNEGDDLARNIEKNLDVDYKNYNILIINDGSTDNSAEVIDKMIVGRENIKFINHKVNHGKAWVLNDALKQITTEYFLCLDSDAYLLKNTLTEFNLFIKTTDEDYSALTGNPKLMYTKSSRAVQVQQLEYRSIIGTIKKAQTYFLSNILTLSGVCSLYKTKDVIEIGGFNEKVAAEDIDISWQFEKHGKKLAYVPDAHIYMTAPESIYALILQRKRWAMGGIETIFQDKLLLFRKKRYAQKIFFLETTASALWVFSYIATTFTILLKLFFYYPEKLELELYVLPTFILFGLSCLLMGVAYYYEYGEKETKVEFLKIFWIYPAVFWFVMPMGFMAAVYQKIFGEKSDGRWRNSNIRNLNHVIVLTYLTDFLIFSVLVYMGRSIVINIYEAQFALIHGYNELALAYFIVFLFLMFIYFINNKSYTGGNIIFGIKQDRESFNFVLFNPIFMIYIFHFSYLAILFFPSYLQGDSEAFLSLVNKTPFLNIISTFLILLVIFDHFTIKLIPRLRGEHFIEGD